MTSFARRSPACGRPSCLIDMHDTNSISLTSLPDDETVRTRLTFPRTSVLLRTPRRKGLQTSQSVTAWVWLSQTSSQSRFESRAFHTGARGMALSKGPDGVSATWRGPSCTSRPHPGRTDSTSLSHATQHFRKPWTLRSWCFKLCQHDLGVKSFHGDRSTAHFPRPLSSGPDGARFSGRDARAPDSPRQA